MFKPWDEIQRYLPENVRESFALEDINEIDNVEHFIRAYTNNKFQVTSCRFAGSSQDKSVYGHPKNIYVGDTVEISQSNVNDGLYIVSYSDADHIELIKNTHAYHIFRGCASLIDDTAENEIYLHKVPYNLVTKVSYPHDVFLIAVDLFVWRLLHKRQISDDSRIVKSESIGRHSITYETQKLISGYPEDIAMGLNRYRKARW